MGRPAPCPGGNTCEAGSQGEANRFGRLHADRAGTHLAVQPGVRTRTSSLACTLAIACTCAFLGTASAREANGPTLTLGFGLDDNDSAYFHSWVGVAHYSLGHDDTGTFASAGVEFDVRDWQGPKGDLTILDVRPTVRGGIAWTTGGKHIVVPLASLYGLAGFHFASDIRPASLVVGVGLSVPALIALFAQAGVPMPTMIEVTCDLNEKDPAAALRFGWNI